MKYNNEFISKLICVNCKGVNLQFNFDKSNITCIDCKSSYLIINEVAAFFKENEKNLISYSEVPDNKREQFLKMKQLAYGNKSVLSQMYTHYHRYAYKCRQLYYEKNNNYKNILDVGIGIGEAYPYMTNDERKKLVGVDIDRFKLETFAKNYQDANVIQASALSLPFKDNVFDVVQCLAVLEHFKAEDLKIIIQELKRVLKHNGLLVACYPAEGSFLLKMSQKIISVVTNIRADFNLENEMVHRHLSNAREIQCLLSYENSGFNKVNGNYYPFKVPFIQTSLFINEAYKVEKESK